MSDSLSAWQISSFRRRGTVSKGRAEGSGDGQGARTSLLPCFASPTAARKDDVHLGQGTKQYLLKLIESRAMEMGSCKRIASSCVKPTATSFGTATDKNLASKVCAECDQKRRQTLRPRSYETNLRAHMREMPEVLGSRRRLRQPPKERPAPSAQIFVNFE